ncbi:MAG: UvrD-helicase domain-containing protein [Flavobacteriales bacterium]|nr:UvrD-helicase domain-containing protein [Flavobacteriales bacterium]
MFVWAQALLDEYPNAPIGLRRRFPLVLLDEMQDTRGLQGRLLHAVFPRTEARIVVQRVGDSNQEIYDGDVIEAAPTDVFPDPDSGRHLSTQQLSVRTVHCGIGFTICDSTRSSARVSGGWTKIPRHTG